MFVLYQSVPAQVMYLLYSNQSSIHTISFISSLSYSSAISWKIKSEYIYRPYIRIGKEWVAALTLGSFACVAAFTLGSFACVASA